MRNLIEISLDDSTKLYIEGIDNQISNNDDPLLIPVAAERNVIKKTKDFLDTSFCQIKNFSNSIAESIKSSDIRPDEFELEFAVKFSADAGIVISSISTEANITIKMTWNKNKES